MAADREDIADYLVELGATLSGYVDRADPGRIFIDWRARR